MTACQIIVGTPPGPFNTTDPQPGVLHCMTHNNSMIYGDGRMCVIGRLETLEAEVERLRREWTDSIVRLQRLQNDYDVMAARAGAAPATHIHTKAGV